MKKRLRQFRRRELVHCSTIFAIIVCIYVAIRFSKSNPLPAKKPYYTLDNAKRGYETNSKYWIPDVVHLLRFGNYPFEFIDAAQIRSIYLNHGPESILIHTDNDTFLQGKYWDMVKDIPGLDVVHTTISMKTPFGDSFSSVYHACDFKRMEILRDHGGMYFDRDVLILRPLRWFLRFEFVADYNTVAMSSQLLLSQPKARYTTLFLNSYDRYQPDKWYYNAGQRPQQIIARPHPHLIHKIGYEGGVNEEALVPMFSGVDYLRETFYAVHYYYRYGKAFVTGHPDKYDEITIKTYNCSLGRVFRELFYGSSDIIKDTRGILSTQQLVRIFGYPEGAKRPFPNDTYLVPHFVKIPSTKTPLKKY